MLGLETSSLFSEILSEKREITCYSTPEFQGQHAHRFALLVTDGQLVPGFARRMSSLATRHGGENKLAKIPVANVGVHSRPETRAAEYLFDRQTGLGSAFDSFFCVELLNWAKIHFGLELKQVHHGILGISLGGAFALRMGLRHSEQFSFAGAFSVAGLRVPEIEKFGWLDDGAHVVTTRFYLSAGQREKPVLRNLQRLANAFGKRRIPHVLTSRPYGHEMPFWMEEFPMAIRWWIQHFSSLETGLELE